MHTAMDGAIPTAIDRARIFSPSKWIEKNAVHNNFVAHYSITKCIHRKINHLFSDFRILLLEIDHLPVLLLLVALLLILSERPLFDLDSFSYFFVFSKIAFFFEFSIVPFFIPSIQSKMLHNYLCQMRTSCKQASWVSGFDFLFLFIHQMC